MIYVNAMTYVILIGLSPRDVGVMSRILVAITVIVAAFSLSLVVSGINRDVPIDLPLKTDTIITGETGVPTWFVIQGLVYSEINLAYAELARFPMVSEVAELQCVGSGNGSIARVTYNWTGVPLFYLLNMAGVVPGAYREVVFNATDGFSDSISLDTAMDPTTLLGLRANGTDLRQVSGFGGDYRIVLPGRWGYKWVRLIRQIVVVDYNYNGTYEGYGFPDSGQRPDAIMPETSPPTTNLQVFGHVDDPVRVLTNSTIEACVTYRGRRIIFNVTGQQGTHGYFYVVVSRQALDEQYHIWIDRRQTSYTLTMTTGFAYLWLVYAHGDHMIEIEGSAVVSLILGGGACGTRQSLV